ncbi:MAG: hypothetical protein QGH51_06005 [Planctomycetota bacterium]|nr:hypothetical protein [Planctomycetota bacterium]
MRTPNITASLLLASLCACGGDSAPTFSDPVNALDAASRAVSAKDMTTARAGFTFASENAAGNPKLLYQALMGLGEVQTKEGNLEEAYGTFSRVESECATLCDLHGHQRIIDAWLSAGPGALSQAKKALAAAEKKYPNELDALERQRQGIHAVESGDTEALSGLGYVGD